MDAEMANSIRPIIINLVDRLQPIQEFDLKKEHRQIASVANLIQAYALLINKPVILTAGSADKADLSQFGIYSDCKDT